MVEQPRLALAGSRLIVTRCGVFSILFLLLCLPIELRASDPGHLRFAQVTDMHIFDAGYKCFAPDVQTEYAENLKAFEWAIAEINKENKEKPIDFVAMTGDLGIENLALPGEAARKLPRPPNSNCNPRTAISNNYGPVSPLTLEQGASATTDLLLKLEVPAIYIVPGNNDIRDESRSDLKRYKAFIQALAAKMPGRIVDLTENSSASPSGEVVNGYRLIGVDSASFKPTDEERNAGPAKAADPIADCDDPHPSSDISVARQKELERVRLLMSKSTAPALLFTHVPDLIDPYPPRQKNDSGTCLQRSAWVLNDKAITAWKDVVGSASLVSVFAGHFHSIDANLYGRANANAMGSAGNVYVAPPLAMRLQWTSPKPQRGFMLVTVEGRTVKPELRMYPAVNCCDPGGGMSGTVNPGGRLPDHTINKGAPVMLSNVLGILIAFVTIILLLSMVVTGLVQATQAVLRLRSRNLQQGVAALLAKYSGSVESKMDYRGLAAKVLNSPKLALLERVDKGDSKMRRLLGPKVSWAPPAELAGAIAHAADLLRAASPDRAVLSPDASPQRIEQDVVRMEPALRKRFQMFIRLWTIFWSLIVAVLFQVNTPDLLSSFGSQPASTAAYVAAADKDLTLAKSAGSHEATGETAGTSAGEGAEAQLQTFGIRFWGGHTEYYFDPNDGLHWPAIIGVLMTGILMSFGAPFWFQKLQFLASLRDQKSPQAQPNP
jgi:3',5'-cyclic AMP phosphodiesterase CpdA